MKTAFFDCFSGISGDMCLGALVDAGVNFEQLDGELKKLALEGYSLRWEKIKYSGISAVNFFVDLDETDHPHRHLSDIQAIIEASDLPDDVKEKSIAVFSCLARAEAKVHATTPDRIHFHEVGAVDAIIDVVGTILGLHLLGVEKVVASPLPMGRGIIHCMHGAIPSPAPATLEILSAKNVPIYGTDIDAELVTPTGAALITTLGEITGEMPSMTISRVGYGAGKKSLESPNLLRIIVGDTAE